MTPSLHARVMRVRLLVSGCYRGMRPPAGCWYPAVALRQLFLPLSLAHHCLGVVNAYQAGPEPPNPRIEVDFLFDRMFYRKIFPVFAAQKRTIRVISTFEMNFPLFAFYRFLKKHICQTLR